MYEFEKVHEDARGEISKLRKEGKEIGAVITFNKGAPRGGHYHPVHETMFIIDGELEYRAIDPHDLTGEINSIVRGGGVVEIPSGIAHLFTALKPSLLIEVKEGDYEATTFESYRKKVDEFLAKH
jgi:quercetin dioxygenase-like cupin family protein